MLVSVIHQHESAIGIHMSKLPRRLSGKEPACKKQEPREMWVRSLGRKEDRGTWRAIVHRVTKSHTWLKWLSTHACILMSPPSWNSSHFLPHSTAPGYHRESDLSSMNHTANSHWLSILYMVMHMFQCYSLNSSLPLLPSFCPQVCFLYLSPLLPCK